MSKIEVGDWVTVSDASKYPDVAEGKKYIVYEAHKYHVVILDDINDYYNIFIDDLTLIPKTTPRPHTELRKRWLDDDKMVIQFLNGEVWDEARYPKWHPDKEYREKPSEPTERDLIMKDIREAQEKLKDAEKRLQELGR